MPIQPDRIRRTRGVPTTPIPHPGDDGTAIARYEADAASLVARVSGELTELSLAVAELQAALGATLAAAAAQDPAVMLQAQKLDLVTQWLQGLSLFLSGLRHRRIGREPLDFDALAAPLGLAGLGGRLAGRVAGAPGDGVELF